MRGCFTELFPSRFRKDMSLQQGAEENKFWFRSTQLPEGHERIVQQALGQRLAVASRVSIAGGDLKSEFGNVICACGSLMDKCNLLLTRRPGWLVGYATSRKSETITSGPGFDEL